MFKIPYDEELLTGAVPISICRKRVGLTAGGMKIQKHCTPEKEERGGRGRGGRGRVRGGGSWVAPYYSSSLSTGEKQPEFPLWTRNGYLGHDRSIDRVGLEQSLDS